MDEQLPSRLAERLKRPLPGPMTGTRFEALPRHWRGYDDPAPGARRAAVLALLYPHQGRWHLALTLRRADLPDHGGQVSLPGGAIEPGESCRDAALREFHEELGAAGHPIELLGKLSTVYVAASDFLVKPWVGATATRPPMTPNPAEVDELIEVPLDHLVDRANFGSHQRESRGRCYTAPHFAWQNHRVWGATCMILGELVTLLEEIGEF